MTMMIVDQHETVAIATVARTLGGAEPVQADSVVRYEFASLTAALIFLELAEARSDLTVTTKLHNLTGSWRVYVAANTARPHRFDQCDDTCTVDCGHCKGDHTARHHATV